MKGINSIDETVIINKEFIKLGENGNGGWNKKQLAIVGITWPPFKGWIDSLENKVISYEDAVKFIELKRNKKEKTEELKKIKKATCFIETDFKLSWEEQYKHPNWQRVRLIVLNRDNFACCKCGDKHSQLHVHHLKYNPKKNIWDVELKNLITLCDKCHKKEHKK